MLERMVTSSVLILVLCALRFLLRGRVSARVMYGLWLLVALRLLLPVGLVESPASVMNVVPSAPVVEETLSRLPAAPAENPVQPERGPVLPQADPESRPEAPAQSVETEAGPELWPVVWGAGALAVAVWFLLVNLHLRVRLRGARRLEMEERVPLYVAEGLPSPCVVGLFRPAIYVTPPCLEDERRMRHVLAHERTHLRHGDPLWAWLRCLCLALYWFHPLVWVAAALSRRDCELACDEGTVARLGEEERIPYGRTLVDLVAVGASPNDLLQTATTMAGRRSAIRERVTRITRRPRMLAAGLAVAVLAAGIAAVCTFTARTEETPTLEERLAELPEELADTVVLERNPSEDTLLVCYHAPDYQSDYGGYLCSLFAVERAFFEREYDSREMTGGWDYLGVSGEGKYYILQTPTDVQFDPANQESYVAAQKKVTAWLAEAVKASDGTIPVEEDPRWQSFQAACTFPGEHRLAKAVLPGGTEYYFVLSQPVEQGEEGIWCVDRWITGQGDNRIVHPQGAYSVPMEEYYARQQQENQAAWSDPEQVLLDYWQEAFGWQYVRPESMVSVTEEEVGALVDALRRESGTEVSTASALQKELEARKEQPLFLTLEQAGVETTTLPLSRGELPLEVLTQSYDWYPQAGGEEMDSDYTVTLTDGAGFSLRGTAGRAEVAWTADGRTDWYRTEPRYPSDTDPGVAGQLRLWYDEREADFYALTLPVEEGEPPARTMRRLSEALAAHIRGLTPGSCFAVSQARSLGSGIFDVDDQGQDALAGTVSLALSIPPESVENSIYQAGSGLGELSGDWTGWYGWGREVMLRRDGARWQVSELGTGGMAVDGAADLGWERNGASGGSVAVYDDSALWRQVEEALDQPVPVQEIPAGDQLTLFPYGRGDHPTVSAWRDSDLIRVCVGEEESFYAAPGLWEVFQTAFARLEREESVSFTLMADGRSPQALAEDWAGQWLAREHANAPYGAYGTSEMARCVLGSHIQDQISFSVYFRDGEDPLAVRLERGDGVWHGTFTT